MAEGKKSFILYADLIHTVRKMPKDKAGELFMTILSYVNDEKPIIEDMIIDLVFEPIKRQMQRDLVKYEETKERFSKAGNASVIARRLSKRQLYILKLYSDAETFLKVGITDDSIGRRYASSGEGSSKLPYKFEIVYQYLPTSEGLAPADLEEMIKERFKKFQYSPLEKFAGHTECYKFNITNDVVKFVTTFNDVKHANSADNDCSDDLTVNGNDNVNDTVTVTVNDNDININKDTKSISIKERKLIFLRSLSPFEKEFGLETVREFFDYWSESNDKGKKMRFEMEDVFDRKRRLDTWKKNEAKFKGNSKTKDSRIEKIKDVVITASDNLITKFENEND